MILLVEDETVLRKALTIKLTEADYLVCPAQTAADAWRKAERCRPDLILLDYILPHENGLQFLQRLRKTEWGKDIPVVMLSALDLKDKPEFKGLGVKHFLVKSQMELQSIVDIIKGIL
jgi:two-component system, OmpR family, phosphate regulon response regulator PhoB